VASGSRQFMQPVVGPSGPPVAGPSGAPDVAGPSGPPIAGPSGPPADVNPAQFDPLAEIEDARSRKQDREDRLEMLEKKRNSARINVYLFLAVTVILGVFSFFPGPIHGDVSENPQAMMGPGDAEAWVRDGGDNEYRDKIWDGSTNASSAHMNIYIPPPLPDMGSTSAVRVDVTFVSYRGAGSSHFKAGMFDGNCGVLPAHEELSADSWHLSEVDLGVGESVEFTLYTQPGQKCILVEWVEPIATHEQGIKATMDVEVAVYWPRMFTIPVGLITFLMAGFAFIGAQKTGKAFKALKYPEGRPEKKVEEEVLEAAETEQRGEQLGVPEIDTPEDADTPDAEGPTLAEAAATPEQDDVVTDPTPVEAGGDTEMPAEEPEQTESEAPEWTDEQLLGAGWTQEQIDTMRNG